MKQIRLNIALLAIALLAALPPSAPTQAAEAAPVSVPASRIAIWQAIDQRMATLAKLIQAGTLGEVHHHAFAIRDLTAALLTHENKLTPDQSKQFASQVKFVAILAERLDASGDSSDRAGAAANYSKLTRVLDTLRGAPAASIK